MKNGKLAVAIVGAAVPVELVLAAGLRPLRLKGAPRPTPLADAYGIRELDGPATAAFEQLLDGTSRFALIGTDTLPQIVLFQALRELRRIEPAAKLPEIALVDMLHLPYRTTARYDRGQLERVLQLLEGWSGEHAGEARLRAAIDEVNEARRRLARIAALRAERPARISGAEAFRLVDAELTGAVGEVLPDGSHAGRRIFLTGSPHEDATVYELLESQGCVVVGEDHVRGGGALGDGIEAGDDPLGALAEHYQRAHIPTRCSSADRAAHVAAEAQAAGAEAVVSFTYAHDGSTPWDLPSLRGAAEAAGLRFVSLPAQPFGAVDAAAVVL